MNNTKNESIEILNQQNPALKEQQRLLTSLKTLLLIAIEQGYTFNYRYDINRMRDWLRRKSSLFIAKSNNSFFNSKYYYSIIFDINFLDIIHKYYISKSICNIPAIKYERFLLMVITSKLNNVEPISFIHNLLMH